MLFTRSRRSTYKIFTNRKILSSQTRQDIRAASFIYLCLLCGLVSGHPAYNLGTLGPKALPKILIKCRFLSRYSLLRFIFKKFTRYVHAKWYCVSPAFVQCTSYDHKALLIFLLSVWLIYCYIVGQFRFFEIRMSHLLFFLYMYANQRKNNVRLVWVFCPEKVKFFCSVSFLRRSYRPETTWPAPETVRNYKRRPRRRSSWNNSPGSSSRRRWNYSSRIHRSVTGGIKSTPAEGCRTGPPAM